MRCRRVDSTAPDLGLRRESERVDEDLDADPRADQHFGPLAENHLPGWQLSRTDRAPVLDPAQMSGSRPLRTEWATVFCFDFCSLVPRAQKARWTSTEKS